MKYYFLSEEALTIDFGNNPSVALSKHIHSLVRNLKHLSITYITDIVPAATTICIFFDLSKLTVPQFTLVQSIISLINNFIPDVSDDNCENITIPICMHNSFGLDINDVCATKNKTIDELKAIFFQKTYTVSHVGFLPGFPYLLGLNDQLYLTRKPTPLSNVPAGSVAIANNNVGIYPIQSPGGWHIIGRTPLDLYNPTNEKPFLLQAGANVQFEEIDLCSFELYPKNKRNFLNISVIPDPTIYITKCIGVVTIQAKQRMGYLAYGVPKAGTMNPSLVTELHRILKNQKDLPVIEVAMGSLQFQVIKPCCIAFGGATTLKVNNTEQNAFEAINLQQNDCVTIAYNGNGIYGYVAIKGLINLPLILNSYSTSVNAQVGYQLKINDSISVIPQKDILYEPALKKRNKKSSIRCFKGSEYDYLSDISKTHLTQGTFAIDLQANRMAIKLQGHTIKTNKAIEMISTAVTIGTVQLTPNGQLIILMNDAQTTGGYPRVLQIAAIDIELLALHKPGDFIQFVMIDFNEACEILKKEKDDNKL